MKSLKVMLLGIALILFGLNQFQGDYGLALGFVGLVVVFIGFFIKDNE